MESPLQASRLAVESDLFNLRNHNPAPGALLARGTVLPIQADRQVDYLDYPAIPAGGGGGSASLYPFDVISAGTAGFWIVEPGTVNQLLPANYNSTFTASVSSTWYITLNCTASNGQVTGVSISFSSSAPAAMPVNQGQPPTSFSLLVGLLINGTWIRTIGDGSLAVSSQLSFQTSVTSPAPGTLPYANWYTWTVGLA